MAERWFTWNWSIAMRTGVLEQVINEYKYGHDRRWAPLFGRILVGFLEAHQDVFRPMHLIVASPTYLGDGARRTWDHTREVLRMAQQEEGQPGWPFDLADTAAVIKTAETASMVGMKYRDRRSHAEGPLREALAVPDAARVRNRRIVVFDDVFTDGLTQREVARALRHAGATEVFGLTLARQPYRGL